MDKLTTREQQLLELADKVHSLYEADNYRANLLNEVLVNENTHSRILRLLLSYCVDYSYPFFASFMRLNKIANVFPSQMELGKPLFVNEWARIDLLIKAPLYAIIIENKVRNAQDQDTQIERYINFCRNCGYDEKQIYVLYLTKDGSKKVSDISLTDNAKAMLGVGKESHFIEINYKDDIWPWIKDDLIPYARGKDETVLSALIQYSDYLDELFNGDNKVIGNDIMDTFKEYNISSLSDYDKSINDLDALREILNISRDAIINEKIDLFIKKPLLDYCHSIGVKPFFKRLYYEMMEIRIPIPGLVLSNFCFSNESVGICSIEGNGVDQVKDEAVLIEFQNKGYTVKDSRDKWWLVYKGSPIADQIGTIDFWDSFVPQETVFKQIIILYEEIVGILSGINKNN